MGLCFAGTREIISAEELAEQVGGERRPRNPQERCETFVQRLLEYCDRW